MHSEFLNQAIQLKSTNTPFATASIVRRKNPSSGKPGDKAIITSDGKIHGWIGGGCTRGIVLKEALESLQDRKPRLVRITPTAKENNTSYTKTYTMTCQSGGEVDVYIEPVLPKPKILIFGGSHIAMSLCRISKSMGYQVETVMLEADQNVFPEADVIHNLDQFQQENAVRDQYTIVCTQGEGDAQALFKALDLDPKYLAFVASRLKAAAIFADLRKMGITFDQLSKIKSPAGIDINAKTPEEVAISILAEIIEDFRAEKKEKKPEAIALGDDYYLNPVCNIPIQKSTAKHVLEYNNEKVYFCCDGCKVSFEKAPENYMEV